MTQYIVTILDRLKARERRKQTMVLPSKRGDSLGRRRQSEAFIRFYDLGQVNHELLTADPIWVDHPVLKTPSYTTSAEVSAVDFFQGVRYSVDPFEDADYQAYTDLMFNYPVTEWTQRYKRIEFPTDFFAAASFTTDARISLADTSGALDQVFLPTLEISLSWPVDYATTKEAYLTDHHWAYSLDKQAAIYRGLETILMNDRAWTGDELVTAGYFPCNTSDKTRFKVTATNNSAAADVGALTPTGIIDVFLMPQVGFTFATSNSSDWKTTEALGLCYQVQPRHLWPLYVTPNTLGSGSQWGSDTDVSNYIDYLTGRSGVQLSAWSFTGAVNTPFDYSYSESSASASTWTGQTKWGLQHNGGVANSYYGMFTRGGPILDGQTAYHTDVQANTLDDYFGTDLFRNYSPFLSCVFKMGGQFYYVWDVSGSIGVQGNYTADQTLDQGGRYRISRGISWDGTYISTTPAVRDGSGASYDVQNDGP